MKSAVRDITKGKPERPLEDFTAIFGVTNEKNGTLKQFLIFSKCWFRKLVS